MVAHTGANTVAIALLTHTSISPSSSSTRLPPGEDRHAVALAGEFARHGTTNSSRGPRDDGDPQTGIPILAILAHASSLAGTCHLRSAVGPIAVR